MKILGVFLLIFLCFSVLEPIPSTQAENPEPFASGSVKLSLTNGATRQVEFAAKLHQDGSTSGQMTFSEPREPRQQGLEGTTQHEGGTETSLGRASQFYFKAAFDCMVVEGTRAVMAGTVTESSRERYVGQRVLLVVQDKGGDKKPTAADRLTWGLYNRRPRGWVPSDAEVENDNGIAPTWVATDSERGDDLGAQSDKSEVIGCQSFPLSSFSLLKVKTGEGDIKVGP